MKRSTESNVALDAAAERYRCDGYQVVLHPHESLLPESVRSFQPDFIATQGGNNIAVEVKSRASLLNDDQIRRYAQLFRSLPGWRLDLVVVPDEPAPPPEPKLLSDELLRRRVKAADALAGDLGDVDGAIVVLWTAIEAALRSEIGDVDRLYTISGARLVKEALSLGLITDEEWETLDDFVNIRNQVAHGEAPPDVDKSLYNQVRHITARLINGLSAGAGQGPLAEV